MKQLVPFIKNHGLVIFLVFVVVFLLGQKYFGISAGNMLPLGYSKSFAPSSVANGVALMERDTTFAPEMASPDAPPVINQTRKVVQDTIVSEQVKDVRQSVSEIGRVANNYGGYVVSSQVSSPEGASSGTVVFRVSSDKLSEALSDVKSFAVKVVSEEVYAQDITDQYENLDQRKAILEETKKQFEMIRTGAKEVSDLVSITRELISIQSQIDSIVGQQKYFDGTVKLSRVTVYLSTDEFSLPYTPDRPWRPEVVVKQAIRSLVGSLQSVGSFVIWVVIYSPVWGGVGLVMFVIYKYVVKRSK